MRLEKADNLRIMMKYLKFVLGFALVAPMVGMYVVSTQFQDGNAPEWWVEITSTKEQFAALQAAKQQAEGGAPAIADAGAAVDEEGNPVEPDQAKAVTEFVTDLARKVYRAVRMSGLREKVEQMNALTARFEAGEITESQYFAERRAIFGDNPEDMPTAAELTGDGLEPLREPAMKSPIAITAPTAPTAPAAPGAPAAPNTDPNYDPMAEHSPDTVAGGAAANTYR
jgi:hypothetical protein